MRRTFLTGIVFSGLFTATLGALPDAFLVYGSHGVFRAVQLARLTIQAENPAGGSSFRCPPPGLHACGENSTFDKLSCREYPNCL